ncbi:hypothetical protein K502DRAFT_108754 [Neoconidiobolus thromboides FSU 785]|nr:hypothetical protein K502DRAFT_108754 [Neoconidiobolus thromboides FSU 785]
MLIFFIKNKKMNALTAKYVPVNSLELALNLKLPVEQITIIFSSQSTQPTFDKYLFLALDSSGSMAGAAFNLAKESIVNLCEITHAQVQGISLFSFNESCTEYIYHAGDDFDKFKTQISELFVGGGTMFRSVFEKMGKRILHMDDTKKSISILFFSDGEDNYERTDTLVNDRSSSLNKFKDIIQCQNQLSLEFHSIGFTSCHDAYLLGKMTEIGDSIGSFQYVKQSSDIQESLERLEEILLENKIQLYVTFSTSSEAIKIRLNSLNVALFIVDKQLVDDQMWLSIKNEDNENNETTYQKLCPIELTPFEFNKQDGISFIQVQCDVLDIVIKRLADKVLKSNIEPLSDEELISIENQLNEVEKKIQHFYKSINILCSEQRKISRPRVLLTKKLIDGLKEGISSLKNSKLTNNMIASWQSLASHNMLLLSNKAKNRINRRIINNSNPIDDLEKEIEQTVKEIDFEKLRKEVDSTVLDQTTCPLTRCNFIEALEEGDCIGLGLQVQRSEACVFDSTLLKITNVGPTFTSCVGFMDILSYKIIKEEEDQSQLHGGFDKENKIASVTTGLANEKINAVMPLYINEHHWKVASKRSKTMLSWMATLSVTGGLGNEIKIIPFLVLSKCLDVVFNQPTEHNLTIFKMVLDTCMVIYNNKSIKHEVIEKYQRFIESPLNRMSDSIPNQAFFLTQVLCAIHSGDIEFEDFIEKFEPFSIYMVEEVIRRKLVKMEFEDIILDDYFRLFSIDKAKIIEDKVKKWETEYNSKIQEMEKEDGAKYKEMFIKLLKRIENGEEDIETQIKVDNYDISIPLSHYEFDTSDIKFHEDGIKFIDRIEDETRGGISYILNKIKQLKLNPEAIKSNNLLEEIVSINKNNTMSAKLFYSQLSKEQKYGFYDQNYFNKTNQKRKELVGCEIGIRSLSDSDKSAKSYIKTLIESKVNKEYARKHKLFVKKLNNVEGAHLSMLFLNTQDLCEAAGILKYKVKFRSIKKFQQIVTTLQSKLPKLNSLTMNEMIDIQLAKLEMLVTGKYQGVQLFQGNMSDNIDPRSGKPFKIWVPENKNLYRFYKVYQTIEGTDKKELLNRFKRIFVGKEEYLEKRAKRDNL